MKFKYYICLCFFLATHIVLLSQSISDFVSISPATQSEQFVIPVTHRFQKIIEVGDDLTIGQTMPIRPDFTGYVPIANSSVQGFLSINSEANPGGNTILDINFNSTTKLWQTTNSQATNFLTYTTVRNCSGTVTPWGTIISSEEASVYEDNNLDGYNDNGWNVEIDPVNKIILSKLWAMGNFAHENVTIHPNERTAYQGADSNPGYLYKFVANSPQDLNSGLLYVYSGSKEGTGNWILLDNTTQLERNSTLAQSLNVGATVFNGIEDVEIGPDGMVYFAVKGENKVYRFQDSDPITGTSLTMETFVGGKTYDIQHLDGTTTVSWGGGNDNLAFDGEGNLWVLQDGVNHYIWVVESGHTQSSPKVKLFGIAPIGSEPTGITFTPDFNYLFMSIQHPNVLNNANQIDAAGNVISFSKGITMVIALKGNLGETLSLTEEAIKSNFKIYPNPVHLLPDLLIEYQGIKNVEVFSINGQKVFEKRHDNINKTSININHLESGMYFLQINYKDRIKFIVN
ncbi:hypothetical protein GCM10023311_14690 [Flaviramulus aquimarinus]|uniref:Secretion system C-terminal sorting domain-containing protein n=1 Tax=Flaviramulus aquimarinus TaxID=1170456 RepID=A0ABP9F071_9FLAO